MMNLLRFQFIILILILSSCAENAFNEAKKVNTISAYQNFIQEYPKSDLKNEALQNINDIHRSNYNKLDKSNITSVELFLKKHKNSPFFNEVFILLSNLKKKNRQIFIKKRFEFAKNLNTEKALINFKNRFPDSQLVYEADKLIQIIQDEKIYNDYKNENNLDKLYQFLDNYSANYFVSDAKRLILKLEDKIFEDVKKEDTKLSYMYFIKNNPRNHNLSLAQKYLDDRKERLRNLSILIWEYSGPRNQKGNLTKFPFQNINSRLNDLINEYWSSLYVDNQKYVDEIDELKKMLPKEIKKPVYPEAVKLTKDEFETTEQFKVRTINENKKRLEIISSLNNHYINKNNQRNKKLERIKIYIENLKNEQEIFFSNQTRILEKKKITLEDKFSEFKLNSFQNLFKDIMGNPLIHYGSYNADEKKMYFKIKSSDSVYSLSLFTVMDVEEGKYFKSNYMKYQPVAKFKINENEIIPDEIYISFNDNKFLANIASNNYQHKPISITLTNERVKINYENTFGTDKISEINQLLDPKNKLELIVPKFGEIDVKQQNIDYISTDKNIDNLKISKESFALFIPLSKIKENKKEEIIFNYLKSKVSKKFNLITESQFEKALEKAFNEMEYDECTESQCIQYIQDLLQVENIFKFELIEQAKNSQMTIELIDLDRKYVETFLCEKCNTKELIKTSNNVLYDLLKTKY